MIQLFCRITIDEELEKLKYVKKNLTVESDIKINNKLLCMIDIESKQRVTGLIINNNGSEYNIKILSKIENISNEEIEKLIKVLENVNEIKEIKDLPIKIKTTVWIECITDYISICSCLNNENILYRGQADRSWTFEPSVFREEEQNQNKETQIYKEILQWNINTFTKKDLLEDICNMQHYGIPTRLMDWTSNPLHALYFAVVNNNEKENDGVVIIIQPSKIIEVNTDEYKNLNTFMSKRYGLNTYDKQSYEKYLENDIINSTKKYVFLKAKHSNDRIKAQQGYFSIYREITEEEALFMKRNELNKIVENFKNYIKKEYDQEIITNFNGIIEQYLRSNYSYIISAIKNKVNEEFNISKTSLDNIFENLIGGSNIKNCICKEHKMSEILDNESYIRIILSHNIKDDLIKDLDGLGINSKVVYPDIEGFAKYIKEKYN